MHVPNPIKGLANVAILAFAIFTVPTSLAQSQSEELSEEVPLKPWPSERRPRMQGKYLQVEIDGPAEDRIKVTSGKHTFIFEDEKLWVLSSTTTPRYSIIMNNRLEDNLTFGIARFSRDEFLASLNDEEWNPYIESIKNDVIPKKIVRQHYTAKGRSAPYIMKNWTRKVEYEYPLSDDKIGKTREIFSFIDGDLFVFIFSGNKETIDANRDSHDIFLTRMNIYTDS